jgi:hypothetical protein
MSTLPLLRIRQFEVNHVLRCENDLPFGQTVGVADEFPPDDFRIDVIRQKDVDQRGSAVHLQPLVEDPERFTEKTQVVARDELLINPRHDRLAGLGLLGMLQGFQRLMLLDDLDLTL